MATIALLASSGMWFLARQPLPVDERVGKTTTGRVGVKATRVGHDWSVQNPTQQVWSQCRAWVGPKSLIVPKLGPGATLSLPAKAFEPPLAALDDEKALELFCAWE